MREFFEQLARRWRFLSGRSMRSRQTYSSSHGYHAVATSGEGGADAGLDRATALIAAAHALADGIFYWRKSGESLDDFCTRPRLREGLRQRRWRRWIGLDIARVIEGIRAGVKQAQRNARGNGASSWPRVPSS